MSIKSIAWAFEQDLSPTDKLVLIVLCDHHNDETGRCDPSIQRIMRRAGVTRRTAQASIRRLAERGFLRIIERKRDDGGNLPNIYEICTPGAQGMREGGAGDARGGGAGDAPKPEYLEPEKNRIYDLANSSPPTVESNQPDERKRGSRLPADWEPNSADRAFAEQHGLDPDRTADEFRDYWAAASGQYAVKRDWSAAWRNRCRQIAGRSSPGNRANGQGPPSQLAAARRALEILEARRNRE